MCMRRKLGFALFALSIQVLAQGAPRQSSSYRESSDEAWWTGPLLAPSAAALPKGYLLVEPYFYDVVTTARFDSSGERVRAQRIHSIGTLTYINWGLTDRLTVGIIPVFQVNRWASGSSTPGIGDLSLQAQYRLTHPDDGSKRPTISINVAQSIPSGRYRDLKESANDALGTGAYTTSVGAFSQWRLWLPNGRILRSRVNVSEALSTTATLRGVNAYDTPAGFVGSASPGPVLLVDIATEYSATRRWVPAVDLVLRRSQATTISGWIFHDLSPQPFQSLYASSDTIALAPALEYNWSESAGIIFGTRIVLSGRNASATVTPIIAINMVRARKHE